MLSIMSRKAAGWPDISRPTSKPSRIPSSFCTSLSVRPLFTFSATVAPIFRASVEPVLVDIRHDHVASARMFHHAGRHHSDRARAGDQHVLAQDRERQGRVHGVPKGIEDGCHVTIDPVAVVPYIGHRHSNVFGKRPGPVHANALGVFTQMPAPGQAVPAPTADHVPLGADQLAGEEVGHIATPPRPPRPQTRVRPSMGVGIVRCAQSSHL